MLPIGEWSRSARGELGQDLVEYALVAAFMALAAAAVLTPVAPTLNLIFSKVHSVLVQHGG